MKKKKIAILGGGVSSMTTAFYLTEKDNWQDLYDITVYQQGWRLGGKGASGRNAEYGDRIEEHGLHIWFGFYVNAFKTIQKAYAAWERPVGSPLATWDEAFKPHNFIVLSENIQEQWKTWPIVFPRVPGNPADGDEQIDLWDIVKMSLAWIKKFIGELENHPHTQPQPIFAQNLHHETWFKQAEHWIEHEVEHVASVLSQDAKSALEMLENIVHGMPKKAKELDHSHHGFLHNLLKIIRKWLHKEFDQFLDSHDEIRRLFIVADLGLTILIGMLEDGVLKHGFNVINNYDYMEWLAKHGANEDFTVDSAPVRGFYDLVFAYEDGNFDKPNVEAGTIIRAMLRIALLYKGGVMWKMQAGMGDTIFSPMYEVLARRGVKFEFFHQVDELIPQDNEIAEIRMTQQVELIKPYEPLVPVKDLPCWPSQPRDEFFEPEQAKLIKDNNINLESFWSDWPQVYQQYYNKPLPTKVLKKGVDFDTVVYGISVASLVHLCPKLLELDSGLAAVADKVKAVATQAYQVWTNKTLQELGWSEIPQGEDPVMSGFTEPYDTWAAMNQLLIRENAWSPGHEAKNVGYFCSALPVAEYPPKTQTDFPAKMKEIAKQGAVNQLDKEIHWLWPEVATKDGFDWNCLLNKKDGLIGQARFDEQYWRSNVDPSERYVLSVKNSSQYRLATNGTIFSNLLITGDWIQTGLNAGCVEAATMAGMQTSQVICGLPEKIMGESDFS
ncbi:hypothetical protein DS2_00925 [Catenovulum agarivorans DS-2]|uniref:Amine oxidase domain-containing protein n=1 Tax=Catenovulum agarivorans DS-2 TaxID=1328313 RepID=W7R3P0_9ALTE|nr:NAD(P)-binding protein [Catenovulum agarivorans]EWH12240.1 hypothetical protein DS2_00925 [Catenovulum agarivorans DS-2]